MSDTSSSQDIAEWLTSRIGEPIAARSTWSEAGQIRTSSEENVSVIPLLTPRGKFSGYAATSRSRVTCDGREWDGIYAVRAELINSRVRQEKRAVAMRIAQIADHDATARAVVPNPWITAQATVPAWEVKSPREGNETIALDIMQWAEPFETAFDGYAEQERVERAVELAIPLFTGLAHIHRHHGMVHRDIHPDNVMYIDGHLVFIDWGIASAVTTGTSTLTQAVGKFATAYPSPEAREGQVGPSADVWALGALLCLMACGESPVLRDPQGRIELPTAATALPRWLRDLIARLTEFHREDRLSLEEAVGVLCAAGRDASASAASEADTSFADPTSAPTTAPTTTSGDNSDDRRDTVNSLFADSYALSRAARHHDALAALESLVSACQGDPDPIVRQHLVRALNNIQWTLYQVGRYADAVATCSRVVDTFGDDSDPVMRQQVAFALSGSAYAKRALGLSESAVADWDAVVSRFGGDPDLVLRRQVAMALRDKGLALVNLNQQIDALSAYTRVIESFDGDTDPVLRRQVAMALNNKRSCLYALGHFPEAAAACTRLVESFGADRDPSVRSQVVVALLSKGLILDRSRQREGALAAYGRLVDIFANDPDPAVQGSVVWAREKLRTR